MSKTTIVLGAGASVHYGFPTGEQLIDNIISASRPFNLYILGGDFYISEAWKALKFSSLLKNYDPISIDRFLSMHSKNEEIVTIGKQLIAHEIAKRQDDSQFTRHNKQNWYKYLYEYIFANNDYETKLKNDEFRIITFNYDLSLECFFHSKLEQTPGISKDEAWEIFLKLNTKIHHVYGSVYDYVAIGEDWWCKQGKQTSSSRYTYMRSYSRAANHSTFQEASYFHNNIKVIGEERDDKQSKTLAEFRSQLQASHRIYILGFGFDDVNMQLIGLNNEFISNFAKKFFCTNYQNRAIVNKKIEKIVKRNHYLTMSDKTVYGALSEDFAFR